MRRVFKTRYFAPWSAKAEVPDAVLCLAVEEMERGLIDADLGGNLYKKRLPLSGRGKRGGARVIVATRRQGVWIFIDGYLKNAQATLTPQDLADLKAASAYLITRSVADLEKEVRDRTLQEVHCA